MASSGERDQGVAPFFLFPSFPSSAFVCVFHISHISYKEHSIPYQTEGETVLLLKDFGIRAELSVIPGTMTEPRGWGARAGALPSFSRASQRQGGHLDCSPAHSTFTISPTDWNHSHSCVLNIISKLILLFKKKMHLEGICIMTIKVNQFHLSQVECDYKINTIF